MIKEIHEMLWKLQTRCKQCVQSNKQTSIQHFILINIGVGKLCISTINNGTLFCNHINRNNYAVTSALFVFTFFIKRYTKTRLLFLRASPMMLMHVTLEMIHFFNLNMTFTLSIHSGDIHHLLQKKSLM